MYSDIIGGRMRIKEHPILTYEKGKAVTFTCNGETISGYEGETIAAALHAAGVKVLKHSIQNHRPRGFYCAIGNCSSCLMEVNGVPNVRICIEPLKADMIVKTQTGKGALK